MALSAAEVKSPKDDHLELLKTVRTNHDEAYFYISQGLSYQEQNELHLARDMYKKGLEKIDKALSVRCDLEYCLGPHWDNARQLQAKMQESAQMVSDQLRSMPANPPYTPPEPFEMPPSYDEAIDHEVVSYRRRQSLPGSSSDDDRERRMSCEVFNLFCIPGDVQLFFVSFDGSVSTTTSQSSLNVYQFQDESNTDVRPPAWLQIGSWTYPLVPGQSPAFESSYGAFLFPSVGAGRDSAVGVILPPSVTPEQRAVFLEILNQLTALKGERKYELFSSEAKKETVSKEEARSLSETISKGIVTGAEYLSAGIVKGANLSSDLIHKGANKAREKIRPDVQPTTVNPHVKEGLKIAHQASGVALRATGFLVKKLGELTVALGAQLAPHIRNQGTKLLASTFKKDQKDAQSTVDGVLTVAAGGLTGFSTIYMGLESAARTLAYSLSSETVNIVGHKYGNEVGEVVGNAAFSIGNLALTTHNVQSLGVKSVVKKTAKDTGKVILKDYVKQSEKQKMDE